MAPAAGSRLGLRIVQPLGVVTSIWRFPLKGMAGETVAAAQIGPGGLVGDRAFAVLGLPRAPDRPWLTARQRPALVSWQAGYGDRLPADLPPDLLAALPAARSQGPAAPAALPLRRWLAIRAPDGRTFRPDDAAFLPALQAAMGCELTAIHAPNMVDAEPVSLLGDASVEALAAAAGIAADRRRFRMNLAVAWHGGEPFAEDALLGRELAIGGARLAVEKRDRRCKVIGVDPDTGAEDPRLLAAVAAARGGCAGVYARVLQPGRVRCGDAVLG